MKNLIKKIRSNLTLKIIIPSLLVIGIILLSLSTFFLRQQELIFTKELTKQIISLGEGYIPRCEKALKDRNDLYLLQYVNEMVKNTDVTYAMVLNSEGKVLVHSQLNKRGKVYQDPWIKKVLKSKKAIIYRVGEKKEKKFHIAFPLKKDNKSNGILQIGVSSLRINQTLKTKNKTLYTVIFASLLFICLWLYWIIKITTVAPLNELKFNIESLPLSKFSLFNQKESPSEFNELGQKISQTFKRFKDEQVFLENQLSKYKDHLDIFLKNAGRTLKEGALFMDSNNKVIFINDLGCKILNVEKENVLNSHILDVLKNAKILNMVKKSLNNPNQIIEDNFETTDAKYGIKITMVKDRENNYLGGIILFS